MYVVEDALHDHDNGVVVEVKLDIDTTRSRRWSKKQDDGFIDCKAEIVNFGECKSTTMSQVSGTNAGHAPVLGFSGQTEPDLVGS